MEHSIYFCLICNICYTKLITFTQFIDSKLKDACIHFFRDSLDEKDLSSFNKDVDKKSFHHMDTLEERQFPTQLGPEPSQILVNFTKILSENDSSVVAKNNLNLRKHHTKMYIPYSITNKNDLNMEKLMSVNMFSEQTAYVYTDTPLSRGSADSSVNSSRPEYANNKTIRLKKPDNPFKIQETDNEIQDVEDEQDGDKENRFDIDGQQASNNWESVSFPRNRKKSFQMLNIQIFSCRRRTRRSCLKLY